MTVHALTAAERDSALLELTGSTLRGDGLAICCSLISSRASSRRRRASPRPTCV
ncbi:hypothetical protein [Novosphingobium sp. AAP93]|uniref:hypothetical protein n=1 Tax=Novosphingobium sp. AAP93 TaxID=1523427 RepID=UPI000A58A957|nr:hypothetical protein [Novosphingobium sp. AAP93]